MTNRMWILGAADPEMEKIESLLRECGEKIGYAMMCGERVHSGNAYRAIADRGWGECVPIGSEIWYLVECAVFSPGNVSKVVIDHHRPGDPGYGRSPSEFLSASSIGQVIAQLTRASVIPKKWHFVFWNQIVIHYSELLVQKIKNRIVFSIFSKVIK